MMDVLRSLNAALRGSSLFNPFAAPAKPEGTAAEFARGVESARKEGEARAGRLRDDWRDAQNFGDELFRAARQATAEAMKLLDKFGASPETLARMGDELQRRVSADAAAHAAAPPRVPMGYAAGERVSLSIEIESLSVSMSADGNSFSMSYTRVSISMVSERYVAGFGADPAQLEDFFGEKQSPLALPVDRDEAAQDPLALLLNVFAPLDKNAGKNRYALNV